MSRIDFSNSTALRTGLLAEIIRQGTQGWAIGHVTVRVRYSRGADFSGACHYADQKILINIGRHVQYPYRMNTHIARTQTIGRRWFRPLYSIELNSAYELVAFIFMHELYHLLVKRAGRNVRQKEGRCDRFATQFMVSQFGTPVLSEKGVPMDRSAWDFQDVEAYVSAAREGTARPLQKEIATQPKIVIPPPVGKPVVTRQRSVEAEQPNFAPVEQLLLFAI